VSISFLKEEGVVMISPCKSPAKGCGVYFAEPPWTKDSPEWRAIDKELPEKAAVRLLVGAVENHLDLQPLWASYGPGGSDALRPDLMLKIVLMEVWSGRQRPSQWCQDARKDDFLKWAGMGVRPSRSTWYHFRNRVGPLLDAWFREVLGIGPPGRHHPCPARSAGRDVPGSQRLASSSAERRAIGETSRGIEAAV
jgi:hypothetical protein